MPDPSTYDYAVIRLVPQVERDEFVNVGVILCCPAQNFAEARIHLDEARILALYPKLDLDSIRTHLEAIPRICAGDPASGPIAKLSQRERFLMLVAPRSTVIQPSPVHTGICQSPAATLDRLMESQVL
ncbi:MAG: DUF3037 domain-containing protein [Rhodothermales bacterium]|nr:DUF3037 domain-containing protein [Rhodothermales bacterium]